MPWFCGINPESTQQKCSFSVVSELQRTILQWLFWIYLTHWCSNSDVFSIAWACQVLIVRCSYWWVLHFWLGLLMFLVDSPSINKLSFEENGKSLRSPGRLLFKSLGWNKSLFRGRVNGMWRPYYTLHIFFGAAAWLGGCRHFFAAIIGFDGFPSPTTTTTTPSTSSTTTTTTTAKATAPTPTATTTTTTTTTRTVILIIHCAAGHGDVSFR